MERNNANLSGSLGEEYAAEYLRERGYEIAAVNYRGRGGEIDIIARRDGFIAFVEVKTRKRGALSPGYEAVSAAKRRRIIAAARHFLYRYPVNLQPRFDVLCLETAPGEEFQVLSAEYYENAFWAEGYSPF